MDTSPIFNPLFFKEMRHFGYFRAFESTFCSVSFLEWEALVRGTIYKFAQFLLCEKTNITQRIKVRVGDIVEWSLPQLHIKIQEMDISEIELWLLQAELQVMVALVHQ